MGSGGVPCIRFKNYIVFKYEENGIYNHFENHIFIEVHATMTIMCSLSCSTSCTILSLLLLLFSLQGIVARRESRLGSSLLAPSKEEGAPALEALLLRQEPSVAWGRLLEGSDSDSSMSMASGPSPTPRPPPSPTPPPQGRALLALGGSLCAGQLPEPKNAALFSDEGYVDTLFEYLQDNYDFDTLEKVCCPREDSYELIFASAKPASLGRALLLPIIRQGIVSARRCRGGSGIQECWSHYHFHWCQWCL